MAKKTLFVFMLVVVIFSAGLAYADNALTKLGRGLANTLTCPMEILKGMNDANDEKGVAAAMTTGIIQGLWNTAVRGLAGVYEVVTFPIPFPKEYAPLIKDPEYFGEL